MTAWEVNRHAVAIAGQVTDSVTGAPIGGARVAILQGPPAFEALRERLAPVPGGAQPLDRPDLAWTSAAGSYRFLDLPAGLYRLEVSVPRLGSRYGTAQTGSIRVWATRDPAGRIKLDLADVALSPTRIHGQVTNQANSQPVAGASVRLRGDTRGVATAADGRYLLTSLVHGTPTVQVSANGFAAATVATSLTAGADQTVNVELTPA